MKNLDLLTTFASQEALDTIRTSRDKLLAFAGIKVDVLEFTGAQLRIRVEQVQLKNNYLLNQRELVSRAGSIFTPLDHRFKLHFVALTYAPDFETVTGEWIEGKMQELGLSRNDVIKQMAVDKSTLSELLSGSKSLTKFHKAAFYYYLLTYEINRDIREELTK